MNLALCYVENSIFSRHLVAIPQLKKMTAKSTIVATVEVVIIADVH